MPIRIKDWSKFQHFKDRRPPWVKLYRDLLDDMEWHQLDAKAAKTLVMFWLIASENDGDLPPVKKLAFRLRITEKAVQESIDELAHWLEPDDGVISERYQDGTAADVSDHQETETETETETERRAKRFALPDWVPVDAWKGYEEMRVRLKKPMTNRARGLVITELTKLRDSGHDPAAVLDRSTAKGWTDVYPLKTQPANDDPYGLKAAL